MADRLEEIAAHRSHDPDIRWLIDQLLACRRELAVVTEVLRRILKDPTDSAEDKGMANTCRVCGQELTGERFGESYHFKCVDRLLKKLRQNRQH